jgi:hypothetical protein
VLPQDLPAPPSTILDEEDEFDATEREQKDLICIFESKYGPAELRYGQIAAFGSHAVLWEFDGNQDVISQVGVLPVTWKDGRVVEIGVDEAVRARDGRICQVGSSCFQRDATGAIVISS